MTRLLYRTALALVLAAGVAAAQERTIQVEVNYTGSGKVDANHKIYVALWESADIESGGAPAEVASVDAKTATVTFRVTGSPRYVSTAYDPTGKWDAQSTPPPGCSLGMYSIKPPSPAPIAVEPGKTVRVRLTFDDSRKMP